MNTQDVAILDFGSGKITVLVGKRGANNTICIGGAGECEYAGFGDGEFFEAEQLTDVIRSAVSGASKQSGVEIKHLYIGVPGEFTSGVCHEVSLSLGRKRKVTNDDVDKLHEMGNIYKDHPEFTLINSQPVYYTLDTDQRLIQPVGLSSTKLAGQISYILAENRFITLIDSVMHEIGIESYDYVSSLLAEILFLFDDVVRDRYIVLIDTGFITTNVVVALGDGILAQYNFSLGGGHITGDLANYFKISFTHAEALKRKAALSLNTDEDDVYTISVNRTDTLDFPAKTVNEIVGARVKMIADTITKCLKICEYEYPDYIPYHITGGGLANIRGARDFLSKHLAKPVEIIVPRLAQFNRPHFSAPLGLLDMVLSHQPAEKKRGIFARLFGSK
ncbi:MAG: hypothetical protein FWH03_04890 [Firmicutes bacterium]|nr:hypothetical protein [Bacillota bacterium]